MDFLDGVGVAPPSAAEAPEEPSLQLDGARRVAGWNVAAERILGWSPSQVLGSPILSTLIAPRHREMFEHVLDESLRGDSEQQADGPLEVQALHRDGHELTLELRLSRLDGPLGPAALTAAFRDITERRELERLLAVNDAVDDAFRAARPPGELIPHILEQLCSTFGWLAGAYWRIDVRSSRLVCEVFWRPPQMAGTDFERLSLESQCARGEGIPGTVWVAEKPTWISELADHVGTRMEAAALDAGLKAAGAVPVRAGRECLGVLEFFSPTTGEAGAGRMAHLESIGLRLGRYLQDSPPAGRRRKHYRLETRQSHLAFSCAFMKFLTVHGTFRDFSGWAEVDDDDPRTARAECTIKTSSVDTRSLERDYHLRSADFFSVERFPSMAFRTTTVEPLGDEHFGVFGDLTIRGVTRPIRLEVRLEDRETDSAGVERMTLSAGTVINRLDWFLDWEQALQAGRWIVGNEVRLDLVISLVHRPQAAGESHH